MMVRVKEYEIRIHVVFDDGFYGAKGLVWPQGSSESRAAYATQTQFSRSQPRAVSYALTELAVAFERGMVPL